MELLKNLLKQHKAEFELNLKEGLIKTTNLGKTLNILKNKFPNIKWKGEYDNTLNLESDGDVDWYVLFKYINNLGWFGSIISFEDNNGRNVENIKFNEKYLNKPLTWVSIIFEAKYDFKVEKISSKLYHVAPLQNYPKIEMKGLIPKSRSKASYHPERVYVTPTPEEAEYLIPMFYQKSGIKEWVLIEIDTSYVKSYLQLYEDPNYGGGYYTLNNIPPISLNKIKTINI